MITMMTKNTKVNKEIKGSYRIRTGGLLEWTNMTIKQLIEC